MDIEKAIELSETVFKPLNPVTVWFRELKRSLYNLYYYFPAIWRSRDWDQVYIYDILAAKLRKMHEYRSLPDRTYMPHVGDEKITKRILECAILAERLSHKTGDFEFADYYYKQVEKRKAESDMDGWVFKEVEIGGVKGYKMQEVEGSEKYWKAIGLWSKKCREQEAAAKTRFFHLLEKYIDYMWD